MKDAVKRVTELLELQDRHARDAERNRGRLEQIVKQMNEEFACKTPEQLRKKLRKEQAELEETETELEKLTEEFDSKYKDKLEGL